MYFSGHSLPFSSHFSMTVTYDYVESWGKWGDSTSLPTSKVWAPPGLWASGGLHLGIKPPSLFSLPIQMSKLCAATGFELGNIKMCLVVGGIKSLWM